MKFLVLFLISFNCMSATITRTYDRQIPEDRKLQLNGLTVSGPINTPPTIVVGTNCDFSKSTVMTCSSCGATSGSVTVTLANMTDGGFYTLDMTDSSTATHTFVMTGMTFSYLPASSARTTAKIASYSFHRIGTKVLVTLMEF